MAWTCPKCKRIFIKEGQQHSHNLLPLEKRFKGKEKARVIYDELVKAIKSKIGPVIVESIPCCIHFVTPKAYTFAGTYVLKDRLKMHFTPGHIIRSPRLSKYTKMAAARYLFEVEIKDRKDIDKELIGWLKEAYHLKD